MSNESMSNQTLDSPTETDEVTDAAVEDVRAVEGEVLPPGKAKLAAGESTDGEAEISKAKTRRARTTKAKAGKGEAGKGEAGKAQASEAEIDDAEISDAEISDAEVSDAEVSDTEVSDTEVSDTEVSDTEASEAEAGEAVVGQDRVGEAAPDQDEAGGDGEEAGEGSEDEASEDEASEGEAEAGPLVGDDPAQQLRLIEALIFASATTLSEAALAERLPESADLEGLLAQLAEHYAGRGVNLVKVAGGYAFRTAPDLAAKLQIEKVVQRKLSRASVETLAIIAYHQPVTRAEIEQIRGVGLSKGTLDLLFEQNWIQPLGRRRAPGKPVTWGTTEFFLEHFGLGNLEDLPGFDDLKAAGLLDQRADVEVYRPDEPDLPLTGDDEEEAEPLATEDAPAGGNDEPKAA